MGLAEEWWGLDDRHYMTSINVGGRGRWDVLTGVVAVGQGRLGDGKTATWATANLSPEILPGFFLLGRLWLATWSYWGSFLLLTSQVNWVD